MTAKWAGVACERIKPLLAGGVSLSFSACPRPLSRHFSRFVVILLFSDIPAFSSVFNGLTVRSTVTLGGLNRLLARSLIHYCQT